ncbi:PQQ-binding-like beta-propeller repeat protein [Halobaculum litoreum]|uniref:PQQ-binding-like beta-propeller repeat protein n=1 Tax=Halobaculum litoreum TaxID=3031998 RepID=A0ABD5XS88_9EURY
MPSSRRRVITTAGAVLASSAGAGAVAGDARRTTTTRRSLTAGDESPGWPMARYDPAGTAAPADASGPKRGVTEAWVHRAPEWFAGTSAPILHDGTLYAAGDGLVALDAATGSRRFGFPGPYRSTPARTHGDVYTTPTLVSAGPAGVAGVNGGGGIALPLVDRPLGGERWRGPASPTDGFFGPSDPVDPVAVGDRVFTPLPGANTVGALDATSGDVRWRRTHHEDDAVSAEFRRPVVRDGTVFVTNWPYQATAYDAATGDRRWQRELDDQLLLPPVAVPAGLVVPSRSSVWLLDPDDGSTLWKRSLDGNATESAPAVDGDTIYCTDERGTLYGLDLATGETRWESTFEGATAPVVADGVVYAVRSAYELVAVDAATGERRFTYEPPQVPLSAPIVGDGVLYLANRRRIVALTEER